MSVVALPGKDASPAAVRPAASLAVTGALFAALLALLYGDVLRGLVVDWWEDPNYSHGFLVPLFSGYLIWEKRERLRSLSVDGSWAGFPLLLAGIGLLLVGVVGAEDFLMRSSLIVVLGGLVLLHLGRDVFRELLFSLGFLVFMVPLPFIVFNAVAFPLQGIAAANAAWLLDTLGVPVLRDGNVLHLSHISLGVTEACSGIRSLISLLALACVWAYLAVPGMAWKAVFVAAAVPITVAANAARVVLTGLVGQWFGVEYASGFFHGFSGWLIFLAAVLCLLALQGSIALAAGRAGGRK
ncbi:MAG: exosortase A [Candidatus Binatia bacterium]